MMQEIEPNLPRLMDSLSDAWAKQRLGNVEVEIVIAEQAKLTKSTIGAMASMVVSRLVAEYPNLARERLAPVGGGYFGHGIAMLRARRIGERRDSRFRFGTLAPVLSLEPRLRDCINRKQRQLNGYARRYGSTHLLVAIPANTASALFSAKDAANGLSHEFAFDAVWLLDATTGIVTPVVRASSAPALGN
ncbi:MAG: hypothetical protein JNM94_12880 [Phycisphaerae bacterium]|nr:hypothetical protein [Phycisphaerae bacterium]